MSNRLKTEDNTLSINSTTTAGAVPPKISVIIPVYNTEKYLRQCLNSVIKQTLRELEIICVNDGSPDNSAAILQEYAAEDGRFKIINQKNQGLSRSRNNALEIATGEYIMFLDSDDWIREDACEILYNKSIRHHLDMLNVAGMNYYDETKEFKQGKPQTIFYADNKNRIYNKEEFREIFCSIPVSSCRYFYRRQFLKDNDIRFPEGLNFEDNFFVRKSAILLEKFGTETEILCFHRMHAGSITQNENKFFSDRIEVAWRIAEMFTQYNVEVAAAKKIMAGYCRLLYGKYLRFPFYLQTNCRPLLFPFLLSMQQKYHFSPEEFEPQSIVEDAWQDWLQQKNVTMNNLQTFNAKMQWLKQHDATPLKTRLADKYAVRDWVRQKIGKKYLIPLLGVYDKFTDIDFEKLPQSFVIKCNHGCGYNIVVKDKTQLDPAAAKKDIMQWMRENYAYRSMEMHYRDIKPKIIIEKYIENKGGDLYDYKFWCFDGKVKYIQFLSERNLGGLKMAFYDTNWRKQTFVSDYHIPLDEKVMERPRNLEKMIKLAEKLAHGFNYVRVDFYHLDNDAIYFGEMTFTPASGIMLWSDEKFGYYFGNLLVLPKQTYDLDTGEYFPPLKQKTLRRRLKLLRLKGKRIIREYLRQKQQQRRRIAAETTSYRLMLFNFIPLFCHQKRGGKQVWKMLGLPIWKVRKFANNITTKYYFLGILLFKNNDF